MLACQNGANWTVWKGQGLKTTVFHQIVLIRHEVRRASVHVMRNICSFHNKLATMKKKNRSQQLYNIYVL